MIPDDIAVLAQDVLDRARASGIRIATAESCTGGLVAGALTEIPGSSDVFERGVVTYSNSAKMGMLDVPADIIIRDGAVSEAVAGAMAQGALASGAGLSVAVTGVAGPGGGSQEKPVGLVWFATATADGVNTVMKRFPNRGRSSVRMDAVRTALELLGERLG